MNRPWRRAMVGIVALAGLVTAVQLGRWQLSRAAEKEALAQAIQAQGSKDALDAHALLGSKEPDAIIHRSVRLEGHWLHDRTVYLDNRQMHGRVGFFVLTPLQLANHSSVIMIQRGWAPRNFEDRNALPTMETPTGLVMVQGRIAPPPSKLYEPGQPSTGVIRQNLDLAQFQQEMGLPVLQKLSVLQMGSASEGLLREWPEVNLGVEKHYGYAAQWFALAVLIAVLYAWFQIRPLLRVSKESDVSRQSE